MNIRDPRQPILIKLLAIIAMISLVSAAISWIQVSYLSANAQDGAGAGASTTSGSTSIAARSDATHVRLEEAKIDVGAVFEGEVPIAVFRIRNAAQSPVSLLDIQASCSCILPEKRSTLAINPGSVAELPVKLRTHGKRGPQRQEIYFFTSSGVIEGVLLGDVLGPAPGFPAELALGDIAIGETFERQFTFRIPSAEVKSVVTISSSDSLETWGAVLSNVEVVVGILGSGVSAESEFNEQVRIDVTDSNEKTRHFVLPIIYQPRAPIEALPPVLSAGGVLRGSTTIKSLRLVRRDKSLTVLSITTSGEWLSARETKTGDLEVSINTSLNVDEALQGWIRLHLSSSLIEDLQIPVYAFQVSAR